MAKPYVFLVHGMGRYAEGEWASTWTKALLGHLRHYEPFSQMDDEELADQIRFVPISYDSIFEGYRTRWGELSGAVSDASIIPGSPVGKALKWIHESGDADQKNFFWDAILDPLLWFALKEARMAVIATVVRQLAAGLEKMNEENEGENASHIIAHSLGTSVIHDSLVSLRHFSGGEGLFDPLRHKWRTISMVANVSRVLENWMDISADARPEAYAVYDSPLRPGGRGSINYQYLNFRHRADPFTWPRQFRPGDWPVGAYSDIELLRYDELKDVHDFAHHIANPRVHVPLLRSILSNARLGTSDELNLAWKEHGLAHENGASNEFNELRGMINGDPDYKLSVKELVRFFLKIYREFS